ncbi:MAG TPA: hypothetical protein VGN57_08500 [Pirellulaceae bacterium]|nr:hypothetical protein [Pirellulaceae bacterium]
MSLPSRVAGLDEDPSAAAAVLLERLQTIADSADTAAVIFVGAADAVPVDASPTERERALRATLHFWSPARWPTLVEDDRLLSSATFPSLVCQFVGVHPAPRWPVTAPVESRTASSEPRAMGWRFPEGTLFRYRDLLVWNADSGDRSAWSKHGGSWSEDISDVHRERLLEFDRFLADKTRE